MVKHFYECRLMRFTSSLMVVTPYCLLHFTPVLSALATTIATSILENRARKFYIHINSPFLPIGVLKY